ncbi:MAG: hypothetical protein ACK4KT_09865 [Thermaurantimonas sp.]
MPPDKAPQRLRQGSGYPLIFALQSPVAHRAAVASPVASSPRVPPHRPLRLISASIPHAACSVPHIHLSTRSTILPRHDPTLPRRPLITPPMTHLPHYLYLTRSHPESENFCSPLFQCRIHCTAAFQLPFPKY